MFLEDKSFNLGGFLTGTCGLYSELKKQKSLKLVSIKTVPLKSMSQDGACGYCPLFKR